MAKRNPRFHYEYGYCRHGVYVGGCGIDWMCGRCESGDDPFWRDEYRFEPAVYELVINGVKITQTGSLGLAYVALARFQNVRGVPVEIRVSAPTPNGWVLMSGTPATDSTIDLARCRARHARRHPSASIGARARRRQSHADVWSSTTNPGDVAARDAF